MDSKDLRNIRTISEEVLQIEAASAEAGTGKYYDEKNPTPQQLAVRAKQEKIKAASNRGKQYQEEVSLEIKKLIESGKFSEEEIKNILWNEGYQRNPEAGEAKEREANKKYEKVRGERTPMPPRGNKRREDFEKWYAANVR